MSCLVGITLFTIFIALSSAGCETKKTFGAGHILDIMLDATESQALTLKINNGVYDYCRSLNLQNSGLSFEEISCSNNIRKWATFPDYDIDITFGDYDADAFQALNESDQIDYVESVDDMDLSISIDGISNSLLLQDTFIHPIYYSYFYSPTMKTLFIFTADQNETLSSLSLAFNKINLITISWNPVDSAGEIYAHDLTDFEMGQQMDITENYFLQGAGPTSEFIVLLDGQKWTTYDEDYMFMVQVNSVRETCDQPEWLRYTSIPDIYEARKSGFDSGSNGTFQFHYADHGYKGIDTRINRAYAYTDHDVWYYEVDDEGFENYRIKEFHFEHKTLSSYWALMWFLIALVLLCCCCCTIYCVKKKRNEKRRSEERFGMTPEQEMMTTEV